MVNREEVTNYEIQDDGGILFRVEKSGSGTLTALVNVYGVVEIDGQKYKFDKDTRVKLLKVKGES